VSVRSGFALRFGLDARIGVDLANDLDERSGLGGDGADFDVCTSLDGGADCGGWPGLDGGADCGGWPGLDDGDDVNVCTSLDDLACLDVWSGFGLASTFENRDDLGLGASSAAESCGRAASPVRAGLSFDNEAFFISGFGCCFAFSCLRSISSPSTYNRLASSMTLSICFMNWSAVTFLELAIFAVSG
jgi:hypothetical protein